MTLIVEDGTGLPGAESPISVSEATALLAEIGITTAWTGLGEPRLEGLLRRATSTIQNEWRFYGSLKNTLQGISFPRVDLQDFEGRSVIDVPRPYKESVAELAYSLSSNPDIVADVDAEVEQVKVGPIDIKLASSSSSSAKTLVPNSVQRKLSLYGWSIFGSSRKMRRISR